MVRTHTLDLTTDAPRSQLFVTIQLLIKDKSILLTTKTYIDPAIGVFGVKIEGDWEKVVWYGPGGGEVHRTGLLVGVNNCEKWDKTFNYTIIIKSTQHTQRGLALL